MPLPLDEAGAAPLPLPPLDGGLAAVLEPDAALPPPLLSVTLSDFGFSDTSQTKHAYAKDALVWKMDAAFYTGKFGNFMYYW